MNYKKIGIYLLLILFIVSSSFFIISSYLKSQQVTNSVNSIQKNSIEKKKKQPKIPKNTDHPKNNIKRTTNTKNISSEKQQITIIEQIANYLKKYQNQKIGIYFKFITESDEIEATIHPDQLFYGASISKLPIILYTQEQIKQQNIKWSDQVQYMDKVNDIPGAMIRTGTGSLQISGHLGDSYTILDLFRRTIVESDNQACNMLGYYVADQYGTQFKQWLGTVYQYDVSEYNKTITAKEAAILLERIYDNKTANNYLAQTLWKNEKIGVLGEKVLHKVGMNENFNHDAAIVEKQLPYILVILTDGKTDSEISQIAVEIDSIIEQEKTK